MLGQARLDGWFPDFGNGYRLFAVNGPGLALATAALKAISLGALSTPRAFAVLGSLSIAALPWAVMFLSRTLGASRTAAAVHALLALCLSFFGGGGLAGLYGPGLLAQGIALPIQVTAMALSIRALRSGGTNVALAATSIAVLAFLHPISVLVLGCFMVVAINREALRARWLTLRRLGLLAAWSAALAGVWLVPAVRGRDMLGGPTGWAIPPFPTRLNEIARGDVLFPQPIALAILAAALVTGLTAERWRRLYPLVVAIAVMALAHYAVGHGFGPYEFVIQLPTRGMALAAILALQPLAELIGDGIHALRERTPHTRPLARRAVPAVACGTMALAAPVLLSGELLDPPQEARPPSAVLRHTAEELERIVPETGRHLLVRPLPYVNLGTNEASRWLAAESGTKSAHLYFWEATKYNAAGVLAADMPIKISARNAHERLYRAGVTHVVITSSEQMAEFEVHDGYGRVWSEADVSIFEVRTPLGEPKADAMLRPAAGKPGSYSLRVAAVSARDAEHVSWSVEARAGVPAVAAVSYDPGWSARVDGDEVPISASRDGLVEFDIPAGRHAVVLDYRDGQADPTGLALSLAGIGGLLVTVTRRVRRPRRT